MTKPTIRVCLLPTCDKTFTGKYAGYCSGVCRNDATESRNHQGRNQQRAGCELANSESGGFGAMRESSRSDGQLNGSVEQLADSERQSRSPEYEHNAGERRNEGPDNRAGNGSNREDVGNASGEGLPGPKRTELSGTRGRSERRTAIESSRPLFPPGRTDYRQWARLVADGLDTTYMPAIESGVSVVAPRDAASAADLLRLGGNAVCPLQAAWAFLSLFACLDPMAGNIEGGVAERDHSHDTQMRMF